MVQTEEVKRVQNKYDKSTPFKLICPRCGTEGHRYKQCKVDAKKIRCDKCDLKNDHVTSQCDRAKKFRERKGINQNKYSHQRVNNVDDGQKHSVSDSEN